MKAYGLLPWQQQALIDAYLAGEKTEAIAEEFGVHVSYPRLLAKRRGHPVRQIGRPRTKRVHPAKRVVSCDSRLSPVIG